MRLLNKSNSLRVLPSAAWLCGVVLGTLWLTQYSQSAGLAGTPPDQWPVASQVPHESGCSRLVLFLHPRCPCSRATLGELERLMADCEGLIRAQVLFLQPEGMANEWVKTDLWQTAAAIPGVSVRADLRGEEARLFQSATSGQAVLYDARGSLMFQGGITLARGHAGDNPGRSAIEALLKQSNIHALGTPVFGCALGVNQTPEECTTCPP